MTTICDTAVAEIEGVTTAYTDISSLDRSAPNISPPSSESEAVASHSSYDMPISAFRSRIRRFFNSNHVDKLQLRLMIIKEMRGRVRVKDRIWNLLELAVSDPNPGRLDDAIDILSSSDIDITPVLVDVLDGYKFDDLDTDIQYILLRAAGRHRESFWGRVLIRHGLASTDHEVREAAVEALGDRGGAWSLGLLPSIRDNDLHPSVRAAADEALKDC